MPPLAVPDRVARACAAEPDSEAWLRALPGSLRRLESEWKITIGAPLDEGVELTCAWVAPVVCRGGREAILKLGMPHMEARDEIAGLRFWAGNPTVRLLESDAQANAMLLERCDPVASLRRRPEQEQDLIVARLLRRLWRRPGRDHRFRALREMLDHWSAGAERRPAVGGDEGLRREGLQHLSALASESTEEVLLATDLHAGNVLEAEREPWLVIDPKPFVGDRAYDATQHLLNCVERLRARPDSTIGRFAERLGVDAARVRDWTFARVASGLAGRIPAEVELARALAP